MAMFKIILETNNPELCDHFEKERVQPQSYLFKWLLTVYTNVINLDAASRVWDLFFMDGDIILYKAAIGKVS
jgi:Rab-GTPase-TBC domain